MIGQNNQMQDQLIDIYDIWYEPFWKSAWFTILIIVIVSALLLMLCYYAYKKYVARNRVVNCEVLAQRPLDALKNFHIVTKQDSKDCYFSLSLIIKHYLASRYNDAFLRLTDEEIMKQSSDYMSEEDVQLLQQIIQGMKFVKFEHEVAMAQKLEKDIDLIEKFIEATTPQRDSKGN